MYAIPRFFARRHIFYGWVIVFLSFILIGLIFGVRLSFGIFFDALTRSGEFGWGRGETAGVFSTTMVVFTLFGAPAGALLDRFGARRVYLLGIGIMASGLVMTSRMTSLGQFYFYYGVWTGLGITVLGLSIHAATISRWFERTGRRGLAIGLAFSGTGVGIFLLAPVLERIIALFGWRAAFLALAGLLLVLGVPLTLLFLRDRPEDIGLAPNGVHGSLSSPSPSPKVEISGVRLTHRLWTWSDAVRTPLFWLMMLGGACSLFTLRMVTVHQVAHIVDNGASRLTAATALGGAGFVTASGFIIFGRISDTIGRARTFYIGSVAQILAILLLLSLHPGGPTWLLFLYAIFWGVGEGSRSGLLTAMASDLFPGPALGAIVGSLGAFFGLGAATGSWLGGWVYDVTGAYRPAFVLAMVATLLATLSIALVQRMAVRSFRFNTQEDDQ
ncbi:MAG: MFS transporter [Caldilineae bacterium]|nr:MAG: MFS transporter [Caldilineae bacterium]